jgi:hypothetical protein
VAHGTFGTAINCMDGRAQEPVIAYLKQKYQLDYVDMITEAGADGALALDNYPLREAIRNRASISVTKHHSGLIAVVGHSDCAGNPVDAATHIDHIRQAVERVRSWGFPVQVVGLWLDEQWQVQPVE